MSDASYTGGGGGMSPLSIAQIGAQSLGNMFSGLFAGQAANARAKAYEEAARQAEQEGGVAAQNAVQRGDAVAARAAVQAAVNGGGFTGSSLGIISNLSSQAMYGARLATYRAQTEARNDLYNAKVQKQDATNDFIGAAVSTISPMVGGTLENSARESQLQSLATLRGLGQMSPYDYMSLN